MRRRRDDGASDKPCPGHDFLCQSAGNAEADYRARAAGNLLLEGEGKPASVTRARYRTHARTGGDARFHGEPGYGDDGVGRAWADAHIPERAARSRDWVRLR